MTVPQSQVTRQITQSAFGGQGQASVSTSARAEYSQALVIGVMTPTYQAGAALSRVEKTLSVHQQGTGFSNY